MSLSRIAYFLDLRLDPEQVTGTVLIVALLVGLVGHALDWYRQLGRSSLSRRDPVLGQDVYRPERKVILDAAQADQRSRLNSVVNIGRQS